MNKLGSGLVALTMLWSCAALAQGAPAAGQPAAPSIGPVASPHIIMLRIYVSDIDRAEKFYHEVFGAISMGSNVMAGARNNGVPLDKSADKTGAHTMGGIRIMTFPGGGLPGLILIQSPEVATMHGSFVIQVPDMKATIDLAAANGGTPDHTHFEGQQAGMMAQSTHFTDPDGNLIEVMQMGGMGAKKP
jgi:predicted enzyme related to lactoylglutathione lyase